MAITIPGHHTLAGNPDEVVLRRTEFIWAAAETFAARRGASIPMAFAPAPCAHRQIGIDALEATTIDWHIAYTSASQQGLRAAVKAGLAVTVLTQGDLEPGMKTIDGYCGLPLLPKAEFVLVWSAGEKTPAARAFGRMIFDRSDEPAAEELLNEAV